MFSVFLSCAVYQLKKINDFVDPEKTCVQQRLVGIDASPFKPGVGLIVEFSFPVCFADPVPGFFSLSGRSVLRFV